MAPSRDAAKALHDLLRGGAMVARGPEYASLAMAALLEVGANPASRASAIRQGRKDVLGVGSRRKVREAGDDDGDARSKVTCALKLLQDGQPGRALDTLEDVGAADWGEAKVKEMVDELFPPRADSELRVPLSKDLLKQAGRSRVRDRLTGSSREDWEAKVKDALWAGDRHAAPGLTGCRLGWLADAVRKDSKPHPHAARQATALGTLATWVDGLLGGGAKALLNTVRLRLIPKKDGKARPLGIGEAIAGVAKRVVARLLLDEGKRWMEERGQWGLTSNGATRAAGVHVEGWSNGWSVAQLDVKNAFNCVHRAAVVQVVHDVAPDAAPFVQLALQPTTMVGHGVEKVVDRGVVQGDPMSPILFALVMGRVAENIVRTCGEKGVKVWMADAGETRRTGEVLKSKSHDIVMSWYADDGTLGWRDGDKLQTALDVVRDELHQMGLELSTAKCVLVPGKDVREDVVSGVGASMGMKVEKVVKMLGVPVGDVEAGREIIRADVAEKVVRLKRVWQMDRPFAEVVVLRKAGLEQSLRFILNAAPAGMVDADLLNEIAAAEDELIRHVFGGYGAAASEVVMKLATHPLSRGGLGLLTVGRAGVLKDGKWTSRNEKELKAWDEECEKAVDHTLRDLVQRGGGNGEAQVQTRRVMEMRKGSDTLGWIGCSISLRSKGWSPSAAVSVAMVESIAIFAALGGDVIPPEVRGMQCPHNSGHVRMRDGLKAHHEQCPHVVTHSRHRAMLDQLAFELAQYGDVAREQEPTAGGGMTARKQGRYAAGQRVLGDVVFTPSALRSKFFLDVSVVSVAGSGGQGLSRPLSDWKFDEKMKDAKDKVAETGAEFIPVVLSTSGHMAGRSIKYLLKWTSGAAVTRIICATLMSQAAITGDFIARCKQ